jgi:hypothetical protein
MPQINFVLRQSDEDLACFTVSESRTLLKLFLDERELKRLAGEVDDALSHLRQCRNLNDPVKRKGPI